MRSEVLSRSTFRNELISSSSARVLTRRGSQPVFPDAKQVAATLGKPVLRGQRL